MLCIGNISPSFDRRKKNWVFLLGTLDVRACLYQKWATPSLQLLAWPVEVSKRAEI
jgi:hypothetical protein